MSARVPPPTVARLVERGRHTLSRLYLRTAPPHAVMMELILNAWTAQAISTAAELGVADALDDGPLDVDELAGRVHADPDALGRLMRALAGRGVFRRSRDGRYALNSLAGTLRSGVPLSVAGMARMVGSRHHRELWSYLPDAVRTGGSMITAVHGIDAFDLLLREPDLADIFHQAMADTTEMVVDPITAAYAFDAYPTIVDIGGGVGRLLAAVMAAAPKSRGVLYDLPQAVADAPAVLNRYQVADRVRVVPGSFFDGVPRGGDLYMLKQVIHDWPDDKAVEILRNVRAAATPGATVLLIELVIPSHTREHVGHWSDLEMLVMQAGRDRTESQYRRLLEAGGFRVSRVVPTAAPISLVEARAV